MNDASLQQMLSRVELTTGDIINNINRKDLIDLIEELQEHRATLEEIKRLI